MKQARQGCSWLLVCGISYMLAMVMAVVFPLLVLPLEGLSYLSFFLFLLSFAAAIPKSPQARDQQQKSAEARGWRQPNPYNGYKYTPPEWADTPQGEAAGLDV